MPTSKGAPLCLRKTYSSAMNRRIDEKTAERINLALLTRAAFDPHTALTYSRLTGLCLELVQQVFSRPVGQIRQHRSFFLPSSDRRANPR
jgi:hypothetical protein